MKRKKGIYLLPSLFTVGNFYCGFYAIIAILDGRYQEGSIYILLAMVLDIIDGKVARLTNTTSQFGVEFDSLADLVSFGIAPGLLIYSWALTPLGRIGWLAAFLFVICGAMRLARFNISSGILDRRYFVGLPTPGAGGFVASMVLLFGDIDFERWQIIIICATIYLMAFLMVSNFKYYSFKDLDFAKKKPFSVLMVVVLGILIIATHPQLVFFAIFLLYAIYSPVKRLLIKRKETVPSIEDADEKVRD